MTGATISRSSPRSTTSAAHAPSWSTKHHGENDCPLELLARHHMRDRRYRVEVRKRIRIMASAAAHASQHLVLIVFQCQSLVLLRHAVCGSSPLTRIRIWCQGDAQQLGSPRMGMNPRRLPSLRPKTSAFRCRVKMRLLLPYLDTADFGSTIRKKGLGHEASSLCFSPTLTSLTFAEPRDLT
jgi:hypothetical protein